MSMNSPFSLASSTSRAAVTALALSLALPMAPLRAQSTDSKRSAASGLKSRAPVTVNFVNADIEAVTRAFAAMIERQIVVDQIGRAHV